MRPPEAPHRRVVRAGGLVGGVEIAEAEAHPAEPDLGGEAAGGARGRRGIAKFPGDAAAWWRGGGEAKKSGERVVARHKAVGGHARRHAPKLAHARPLFPARAILSRCLCYLYSLLYCYIYFIFNI